MATDIKGMAPQAWPLHHMFDGSSFWGLEKSRSIRLYVSFPFITTHFYVLMHLD